MAKYLEEGLDLLNKINPITDKFKGKHKKMIDTLLGSGHDKNEILSLINVYSGDAESYIDKQITSMFAQMKQMDIEAAKTVA